MVLAFFGADGLIYSNIVLKGTKVNVNYIVNALKLFWRRLCLKQPHQG